MAKNIAKRWIYIYMLDHNTKRPNYLKMAKANRLDSMCVHVWVWDMGVCVRSSQICFRNAIISWTRLLSPWCVRVCSVFDVYIKWKILLAISWHFPWAIWAVLSQHRTESNRMNSINVRTFFAEHIRCKIQWLKVFVCLEVIELLIELIKLKVRINKF